MIFEEGNINIHGITPNMVENAPTFDMIWQDLRKFLDNRIVIAHNANFDMSVLRHCIWEYNLPKPIFKTACTVQIARRVWPDLINHKLNTLGEFFQIKFKHHDALDDAKVCAKIPLVAARQLQVASMEDLLSSINLEAKNFKI